MTPERRRQVEQLYHAALQREPDGRAAFLAEAAGDDRDLRAEVEALLAQQPLAAGSLSPGFHLGPYVIEALLGEGGMGKVYKARDTRLGRAVAIKVSREQFTERFQREARAIAALNHPHICTLYDVGPDYLVMEFVDGPTLAARLKKGRLALKDVVKYGSQIAEALAQAHARGIIHRDLKPGNIMLAANGVKLLDFGLARQDTGSIETVTATHAVVGTPAYMAPEQWEGQHCDARTDIFALGLILLEMASGRRLDPRREPATPVEGLPTPVAHVIDRCLARDPNDRWQTARDAGAELAWAAKPVEEPARSGAQAKLWRWAGAAVLIRAMVFASLWISRGSRTPASGKVSRFVIDLPAADQLPLQFGGPQVLAVAPDGANIVYVARRGGVRQLFRRRHDELVPTPIPGTGDAMTPFLSPDGQWVGFAAGGELKKIPIAGGPPTSLCKLSNNPGGASWGGGTIVFSMHDQPLVQMPDQGGTPSPLTRLASPDDYTHLHPYALPDGSAVLFTAPRRD